VRRAGRVPLAVLSSDDEARHDPHRGKNAVPVAMRVVRDWQEMQRQRRDERKVQSERAKESQL
jgi:hypothetical protein